MTQRMICFALIAAVLSLALADTAAATTLHGKVYDIELNELNGVIVEVNSTPQQRYVSKDGSYSFELNPGEYEITAEDPDCLEGCVTKETVTVLQPGEFVFDLFIFPEIDEEEDPAFYSDDASDITLDEAEEAAGAAEERLTAGDAAVIIAVLLATSLLAILFGRMMKRKRAQREQAVKRREKATQRGKAAQREPETSAHDSEKPLGVEAHPNISDEYLKQVIDILKKEDGRTTQKELRKQIPLSEAKISLMIAELEHKGIVQKVKKGRGNILILKKK